MEKGIDRSRRRTDLRIQQAYNRIGPAPEDLPMAPQPVMAQMQRGPSDIGLFSGMLQAGLAGFTTMNALSAPSTGTPSGGTTFNNTTNFKYGGSQQAYNSGLDLGSLM